MNIIINGKNIEVEYCNTFIKKLLGLMFKKEVNKPYIFPKCKSIHTFFMLQSIDIIAIDINNKVIEIKENIKPNKIIFLNKDTSSVIEYKSNCKLFKLNDTIRLDNKKSH